MLPFEPEPEFAMKARYADAIGDIVRINDIQCGKSTPPSKERKHVFDFNSGLRLIISRDTDGIRTYLHFSASVNHDIANRDVLASCLCPQKFVALVAEYVFELTGTPPQEMAKGNTEIFFSENRILHILFEQSGNPQWN